LRVRYSTPLLQQDCPGAAKGRYGGIEQRETKRLGCYHIPLVPYRSASDGSVERGVRS